MNERVLLLCAAAGAIGAVHTILGPDHYVPFVAMSRAAKWSIKKTLVVTLLCGAGHVLSSAVLGLVGIAVGVGVLHLDQIESVRGEIAGWLLLAFGIVYTMWGLRRAARNRPHTHLHAHADGTVHTHEHVHATDHVHVHEVQPADQSTASPSLTPWILFTIFVFGPCEPLIPLVMVPAAKGNMLDVVWVTTTFGLVTLATMTTIVLLMRWGVGFVRFAPLERYSHACAGLAVTMCGVAITFLGL